MTRFARASMQHLYALFTRRKTPTSPASAIANGTTMAASSAPAEASIANDRSATHSTGSASKSPASCSAATPATTVTNRTTITRRSLSGKKWVLAVGIAAVVSLTNVICDLLVSIATVAMRVSIAVTEWGTDQLRRIDP